jgi:ribosomal protein L40E
VAAVAADSADTAYCIFCGESLKRGAIKCSHCGRAVDLRVEGKLEPALPASDSAAEVAPTPVDAGDIKPCSSCGKPIRRDAVKCRHCGSVLDPELRQAQAAALPQGDAPGAGAALGWGIFSIVFILALAFLGFILFWGAVAGPVAIYNGGKALKHISENPAYSGRGKAIAGLVLGIVGTLGSLVTLMGVCNS